MGDRGQTFRVVIKGGLDGIKLFFKLGGEFNAKTVSSRIRHSVLILLKFFIEK